MALSDDKARFNRNYPMRVDAVLAALDDDDRATLTRWLHDPDEFPTRAISRALRAEGHDVCANAVRTWRERHGLI